MVKRIFTTITLLFLLSNIGEAQIKIQIDSTVKKSTWKTFKQVDFNFEGKAARVVIPLKALPGNPWVWRARFPDWHTEMDSILLSEGFHVAYINTDNQYGSPNAMEVWDKFYQHLVQEFFFHPKVSLEGVSRGGLFVYNWAKQNPEKVNCIYAEAPVCDFKSWPAGFGNGEGSKNDWKQLKAEYGFQSEDEAQAYNNNPIDNLQDLAKAKVPVLHMIGLNDEIVPPEENTFVLLNRFVRLGGIAQVIPCTEGKQKLQGHHFPIETPQLGADFIKYYTRLPKQKPDASNYHTIRDNLKNSFIKFERDKKGRVAFLGGSITYNPGWRDSVCIWLQNRFPETEFEFIAAGIPSMGTTPGAFRLGRDVLTNGPVDLLFEEAAVNDATNGRTYSEQTRAMEGIVRHTRKANPFTDIVIMHFVDPDKMKAYREGLIPEVIQNHEKVAEHYNISTINLAKEVTERIDAGEFTWKDDFKNLHPSPFGQNIYFQSIKKFLESTWFGYVADDDKITAHIDPERIDNACYDGGKLIPAELPKNVKGWQWVKNWSPIDKAGTRPNYTDSPMLLGEYPGKILKLKFEGTAVGLTVAAGPDAGIIEYSIDGSDWEKQDLFTKWSLGLHLPWYYTLGADLSPGNHILQIRISEEKNSLSKGRFCRIRYFYFNHTTN